MDDPYSVLGVARDASQRDIRRSFRRLALKHHPDRNPGDPRAEEVFKRINAAYQVLGDPGRRSAFDATVAAGPAPGPRAASTGPATGPGPTWEVPWGVRSSRVEPVETSDESGVYPPTPEDIESLETRPRFVPWKAMAVVFLALVGYIAMIAAFDSASGKAPEKSDPSLVEWLRRQSNFGQR